MAQFDVTLPGRPPLLVPGMVSVHALLHRVGDATAAADLLVPATGYLVTAVVLLALSAGLTRAVTIRRD